MRRLVILAVMVVLGWTWPGVAFAQLGVPSQSPEPGSRTLNPRPQLHRRARSSVSASLPPPPLGGSVRGPSTRSGSSSFSFAGIGDNSGRADLSGHPVAHYPAARGDLNSTNGARVSRGGANGNARPQNSRRPPVDPFEAILPTTTH